jgi:DNA repair exonuclease SbcCD nuclease subunit
MPRSGDLPDDLKPLVRRNALEVSHARFKGDCARLIAALERVLEGARAEQSTKERLEAEQRERLEAEGREKERLLTEQQEKDRPEADRPFLKEALDDMLSSLRAEQREKAIDLPLREEKPTLWQTPKGPRISENCVAVTIAMLGFIALLCLALFGR